MGVEARRASSYTLNVGQHEFPFEFKVGLLAVLVM